MAKRSKPKVSKDIRKLHSILMEVARLYTFRDRDGICQGELSLSQCYALYALRDAGPMSLNELATYLNLEKSSVSRLARKLLDDGLIRKSEDPVDSRRVSLEVSARGRKLYGRVEEEVIEEEKEIFVGISAAERRTAIEILTRIAANAAGKRGCATLCQAKDSY